MTGNVQTVVQGEGKDGEVWGRFILFSSCELLLGHLYFPKKKKT